MSEGTISQETRKAVLRRMTRCRTQILKEYPFYGYLVMHLQLGVTNCGTACTDMKHLMFDPDFAEKLSDEEMIFVMLHELLHCVLQHCVRARNFHSETYNIAADIVVNSNIMQSMGVTDYIVNGKPVMHETPDGDEGCLFSAEEVYRMLIQNVPDEQEVILDASGEENAGTEEGNTGIEVETQESATIDTHGIWETIEENDITTDMWKKLVIASGKNSSLADIPQSVRDYITILEQEAKVDWRTVLHDFIQTHSDRFDYSFSPSDRRYTWSDFVLPAFSELEDEWIENLWFCVDTSGSISPEVLTDIMNEIRQAILLFDHLSGKLSFFDTEVTEPVPFNDEEEFMNIQAAGFGGTDFSAIFDYLERFEEDDMPIAIIVLTDGQCYYPPEEAARDIPVLWIIYDNPMDPPWGRFAHIDSGMNGSNYQ